MEEIGVRELERALAEDDLIIVDEIVKMELFSEQFQNTVKTILDSAKPFLGTIVKSRSPLADIIKKRPDVLLFK